MTVPYDVVADVMKVLTYVAAGHVPTQACDDVGLSYQTFCTYTAKYPQLRAMRDEAEDRCYDVLADRLLTIHEDIADPKMANVASSNTKWLLERRRSRAYGAKSTLEVNITADREVLDALQAAKARAHGRVIETKVADDVLDLTADLTVLNGVAHAVQSAIPAGDDDDAFERELAEIS